MLTFKKFLMVINESATERKITSGFSEHPVHIEGSEIVHHDPETQTTVYHLKHHNALSSFGTQCRWCTSSRTSGWSGAYLRSGNVFGVIKGKNRYQMFVPKKGKAAERTDSEFKDSNNNEVSPSRVLEKGLKSKLTKIKHDVPSYKWSKMSDKDAIRELKGLPSDERLRHYRAIANTGGVSIVPGSTYDEVQKKFNKTDLHHFADDEKHSDFIAAHAPIDDIAHLKDHPNPETRRIVRQRIGFVGGEGNLIKKQSKSTYQKSPDQVELRLPKPKPVKKPQSS